MYIAAGPTAVSISCRIVHSQPALGKQSATANTLWMGDTAIVTLPLFDTVDQIKSFLNVFIGVYILVILIYIITSWIRLPYSPWLNRVQRFLYDVCDPYLRLFRRVVPPLGPLDLSPMLAVIVLLVVQQLLNTLLDRV